MNATQHEILQFIASHPNSDVANIAANCGVEYGIALSAVDRLETEAYIKHTDRHGAMYFKVTEVGRLFVNGINS